MNRRSIGESLQMRGHPFPIPTERETQLESPNSLRLKRPPHGASRKLFADCGKLDLHSNRLSGQVCSLSQLNWLPVSFLLSVFSYTWTLTTSVFQYLVQDFTLRRIPMPTDLTVLPGDRLTFIPNVRVTQWYSNTLAINSKNNVHLRWKLCSHNCNIIL